MASRAGFFGFGPGALALSLPLARCPSSPLLAKSHALSLTQSARRTRLALPCEYGFGHPRNAVLLGILRLLVRAAARHEQQLTSLEADSSYVLLMETGNYGMINMMIQAGSARSKATPRHFKRRRQPAGSRGLRSSGCTRSGTQNRRRPCHRVRTISPMPTCWLSSTAKKSIVHRV